MDSLASNRRFSFTNSDFDDYVEDEDEVSLTITITDESAATQDLVLSWATQGAFTVYADDSPTALEETTTRVGYGVTVPAGTTSVAIQPNGSPWAEGGTVSLNGETYTVDSEGCITLPIADVEALPSKTLSLADLSYTAPAGSSIEDLNDILAGGGEVTISDPLTGSENLTLADGSVLTLEDSDLSSYTGTIQAGEGSTLNLPANPDLLDTAMTIDAGATVNVDGQALIGEGAPLSIPEGGSLTIAAQNEYGEVAYTLDGGLNVNSDAELNAANFDSASATEVSIAAGATLTLTSVTEGANTVISENVTVTGEEGATLVIDGNITVDNENMSFYVTYRSTGRWTEDSVGSETGTYTEYVDGSAQTASSVNGDDYAPASTPRLGTYVYGTGEAGEWQNSGGSYTLDQVTATGWFAS